MTSGSTSLLWDAGESTVFDSRGGMDDHQGSAGVNGPSPFCTALPAMWLRKSYGNSVSICTYIRMNQLLRFAMHCANGNPMVVLLRYDSERFEDVH